MARRWAQKQGTRNGRRRRTLARLERRLELPMIGLSFVWLVLVLLEFAIGPSRALEILGAAIWISFVVEFSLRLVLAPDKSRFLVRNWVTVLALALPAFRLLRGLRFLRTARALRGLRLVKILGTANRGINALGASLGRRGFGYVLAITAFTTLLGAGGMLAFEPASQVEGGFHSYWDALWWTSMLVTSMGSQFWPQTLEGRILCFMLSVYGLAVFGYVTASLASFFVARDSSGDPPEAAEIRQLRQEIVALRRQISEQRDAGAP